MTSVFLLPETIRLTYGTDVSEKNPHLSLFYVQPGHALLCQLLSAAQQDNDVNQKQADQDEGEVDEELLQVSLGLRIHLNLRRSANGRLGHVLNALHGDGLDFGWLLGRLSSIRLL